MPSFKSLARDAESIRNVEVINSASDLKSETGVWLSNQARIDEIETLRHFK